MYRQQLTCGGAELCQREADSPYLVLVSKSVLADQFQLLIEAGLANGRRGLAI